MKTPHTYYKAYKAMKFTSKEEEEKWMEQAMHELTEQMIDVPVQSLQYRLYRGDLQLFQKELVKMSKEYKYQAPMGNIGNN